MSQAMGKKRRAKQKGTFSSAISEQLLRDLFLRVSYEMNGHRR